MFFKKSGIFPFWLHSKQTPFRNGFALWQFEQIPNE